MDVAEGKERFHQQVDPAGRLQQVVPDHHPVGGGIEHDAFGKDDLADAVHDLRHGVRIEIDDVLVAARLVDITVPVDAEVELLSVQDDALVQRRQEEVHLPAERVDRSGQQAVVPARVATDNGRIAVGPALPRQQDFPLQGIGEVHQFCLVEFDERHILGQLMVNKIFVKIAKKRNRCIKKRLQFFLFQAQHQRAATGQVEPQQAVRCVMPRVRRQPAEASESSIVGVQFLGVGSRRDFERFVRK